MKPSSLFSLSLFMFLTVTFHAAAQEKEDDFIFCIKIAASKNPLAKTSKIYKDFPDVEEREFPDGYLRYFVGDYETYHRAKEALPAVQKKGYKDAYVVCIHHGKILSGDEAIMKIYEGE